MDVHIPSDAPTSPTHSPPFIHSFTDPQALEPSAQLDLIERVLVALRAATEGGLMPGADGRKRHMTASQLRLVAAVQPEVRGWA